MTTPRVSVLIPLWRPNLRYLSAAIESVRAQTVQEWELVVVEDAPHFAEHLLTSFADPRLRYIRRESRSSLAGALNEGLAACRASFVARLDGDDIAVPERLERQLTFLDAHETVALVGSSLTIIDHDDRVVGHRFMPTDPERVAAAMRRYNAIAHPSVMFRREVVLQQGGYAENVAHEDYDLWCRLLRSGHALANCREELVLYRFHEEALKFDAVHRAIQETIAIKRRYFRGEFTPGDQLRIAGERALLLLPPRLVLWLFRTLAYKRQP